MIYAFCLSLITSMSRGQFVNSKNLYISKKHISICSNLYKIQSTGCFKQQTKIFFEKNANCLNNVWALIQMTFFQKLFINDFFRDPVCLGGALQSWEGGTRRQQIQESSEYLQSWSIGIIIFLPTQPTHDKNGEIIFIYIPRVDEFYCG